MENSTQIITLSLTKAGVQILLDALDNQEEYLVVVQGQDEKAKVIAAIRNAIVKRLMD